jgi:pimeloyl-ACP methyl ester carboxylesterase
MSIVRTQREFHAADQFSAISWLREIEKPRAIIVGSDDLMTPPRLSQGFQTAWPDAPYVEIANAGHLVMLEQPAAFNRELSRLIQTWSRPLSSPDG